MEPLAPLIDSQGKSFMPSIKIRARLVALPVVVFILLFASLGARSPSKTWLSSLREQSNTSTSPAASNLLQGEALELLAALNSDGFSESRKEKSWEGVMERFAALHVGTAARGVFPQSSSFKDERKVDERLGRKSEGMLRSPLKVTNLTLTPGDAMTDLPSATEDWMSTQVFVISISRDAKQLEALDAKLHAVGLKYTLVLAPDSTAENVSLRYGAVLQEDRMSISRGSPLTTAEVDEFLAHLELWAHVVSQELRYSMVFEEDAVLRDSFQEDFERALKQLNILKAGHAGYFFDVCLLGREQYAATEPTLTANIVEARSSAGAHAYILSLAGALRLLENIRLDDPLQAAMWQVHQLYWLALRQPAVESPMYQCDPAPCRQMPVPSGRPSSSTENLLASNATLDLSSERECGGTAWECLGGKVRGWVEERRKSRAAWPAIPLELEDWPVYVLNMDQETRRMADLGERLKEHGFGQVQRARAVDIRHADFATFKHLVAKDKVSVTRAGFGSDAKYLSKGEVGCGLSHYMIWSDMVEKNVQYALILEDDIDFVPTFSGDFARNVRELNDFVASGNEVSRFDIVFLGREPAAPPVPAWFERPFHAPHIKSASMSWTTHSYILSLQGARKLVKSFLLDDPVDAIWWRVPRIKFLTFEPLLTHQKHNQYASAIDADKANGIRGAVEPWR